MTHTDHTGEIENKTLIAILRLMLFFVIPLAFGLLSLLLGKDINWDLKNYHYYNAYAFLENRMGFDIAPAQLQTYINPIPDLPFYWLTKYFPSWVAGFILGVVHGLNLSFILLIFWEIFNHPNQRLKLFLGTCVVIISSIAPGFLSELGNTMNDNLTSIFVLWAIYLLILGLKEVKKKNVSYLLYMGAAGIIMGLGVGLKPTLYVFAVSSAIVLLTTHASWWSRIKSSVVYGLTGILGGIISSGFWWWKLWAEFGNPLFPFYNNIFKSPYFTFTQFTWAMYLPRHFWEYFVWPLLFSLNSYLVNPLRFFDIRFALLYIIFLVWLFQTIVKRSPWGRQMPGVVREYVFEPELSGYLLIFFLISFVIWMTQYSDYRYIISLELLVPLCFLILLERITPVRNIQKWVAIVAVVITMISFRPFNWGRIQWDSPYFHVNITQLNTSENAVVIMLGRSPTSYVIPDFPANYRFVRPEGNLFAYVASDGTIKMRDDNQQKFLIMIKNLLSQNTGPVYILYDKEEQNIQPEKSLLQLGISPNIHNCSLLDVNTPDQLEFCRVSQ